MKNGNKKSPVTGAFFVDMFFLIFEWETVFLGYNPYDRQPNLIHRPFPFSHT